MTEQEQRRCLHPWASLIVIPVVLRPGGVYFKGVHVRCHACGQDMVFGKNQYELDGEEGVSYPTLEASAAAWEALALELAGALEACCDQAEAMAASKGLKMVAIERRLLARYAALKAEGESR